MFIPVIYHNMLLSEAYNSEKQFQNHNFIRSDPQKCCCLDRQLANASLLGWRISLYASQKNYVSSDQQQTLKDSYLDAKTEYARVLFKNGAAGRSLKYINKSQLSVSFSSPEKYLLQVIASGSASQKTNIQMLFMLRDVKGLYDHFTKPNGDKARYKLYLKISLLVLEYYPKCINCKYFFDQIVKLLKIPAMLYYPFCIAAARHSDEFEYAFFKSLEAAIETNHILISEFFSWLHFLIAQFNMAKYKLLELAIRIKPYNVYFIIRHAKLMNNVKTDINTIMQHINKINEVRYTAQIETVMRWTKYVEHDINTFRVRSYAAYAAAQKYMGHEVDIPEDVSKVIGDDVESYSASNPPVFVSKSNVLNLKILANVPFPYISDSVSSAILDADGSHEATISYFNVNGELKKFVLVSPLLFRYSESEQLFTRSIGYLIHRHPNAALRSAYMIYPHTFAIHENLLAVNSGSFSTIKTISNNLEEFRKEKRLYQHFIQKSDGSVSNFMQLRQCFASQLAGIVFIRTILRTPHSPSQSLSISEDLTTYTEPDFFTEYEDPVFIPLTPSIGGILPEFALRGSFSATFCSMADALNNKRMELGVILEAFCPENIRKSKVVQRTEKLSPNIEGNTCSPDRIFAFDVIEHLVSCSANVVSFKESMAGWI